MNDRSRKWLPLGAGLVLGGVLLVRWLWPTPEFPTPTEMRSGPARPGDRPATPSPAAPLASESAPRPSQAPRGPEESATPGEDTSSAEAADAPPPQNDPIEPELPQTAAWKHDKLVRITELLDRDVERLEAELRTARGRANPDEIRRLEVTIARHRARLASLREETAALAKAAQEEERRP